MKNEHIMEKIIEEKKRLKEGGYVIRCRIVGILRDYFEWYTLDYYFGVL